MATFDEKAPASHLPNVTDKVPLSLEGNGRMECIIEGYLKSTSTRGMGYVAQAKPAKQTGDHAEIGSLVLKFPKEERDSKTEFERTLKNIRAVQSAGNPTIIPLLGTSVYTAKDSSVNVQFYATPRCDGDLREYVAALKQKQRAIDSEEDSTTRTALQKKFDDARVKPTLEAMLNLLDAISAVHETSDPSNLSKNLHCWDIKLANVVLDYDAETMAIKKLHLTDMFIENPGLSVHTLIEGIDTARLKEGDGFWVDMHQWAWVSYSLLTTFFNAQDAARKVEKIPPLLNLDNGVYALISPLLNSDAALEVYKDPTTLLVELKKRITNLGYTVRGGKNSEGQHEGPYELLDKYDAFEDKYLRLFCERTGSPKQKNMPTDGNYKQFVEEAENLLSEPGLTEEDRSRLVQIIKTIAGEYIVHYRAQRTQVENQRGQLSPKISGLETEIASLNQSLEERTTELGTLNGQKSGLETRKGECDGYLTTLNRFVG